MDIPALLYFRKNFVFTLAIALTFHYLCKRKAAVRYGMSGVMALPGQSFYLSAKTESIHILTLHIIIL